MSEVKCSTCKGEKTLTFERGQRCVPCVTCSGSGIDWRKSYDAAQSQLAALREERDHLIAEQVSKNAEWADLREELATLQTKKDRTESALNGSMKALTRVDNMWKKRWLEKTGEPAIALVVDDEFKAMFEEIKSYRQRLADAERRNAVFSDLLKRAEPVVRGRDIYGAKQIANEIKTALNPNPEAASHDE